MAPLTSRIGAACYVAWGVFHVYVAWQIYGLALTQNGIAQGRLLQLAVYIVTIAIFAVIVGAWRNWQNDRVGYWLNLLVIGWADAIWVLTVVLPGYVPAARGLIPPTIYLAGVVLTTVGRRKASDRPD